MVCFEVTRNGKRLTTAGIRGKGALTVMLGGEVWRGRPAGDGWELWIGGLDSGAKARGLRWTHRLLKLDDTIVIRIVRSASADEPSVLTRPRSAQRPRTRRRASR
jgi:hypothetical protein